MIYPKEIVQGLNRLNNGHFQNIINFKTFFSHASLGSYPGNLKLGISVHSWSLPESKQLTSTSIPSFSQLVCMSSSNDNQLTAVTKISYNTYLLLYIRT